MKRTGSLLLVVLLAVFTLTACGKPKTVADEIASGKYDWDAARVALVSELSIVLETIHGGESNDYAKLRMEWLPRVVPEVQGAMFPNTAPPQGCSVAVSQIGYSGPKFNSEGAEYLMYTVRVMNNQTLEAVSYKILIQMDRGANGYVISGFDKEVVDGGSK